MKLLARLPDNLPFKKSLRWDPAPSFSVAVRSNRRQAFVGNFEDTANERMTLLVLAAQAAHLQRVEVGDVPLEKDRRGVGEDAPVIEDATEAKVPERGKRDTGRPD